MDILLYLSELVHTRKVIGISGLGTIYKKKSPGRYNVETHSFVPPSYILEFTEELKEDVLLPEFISRKRNVSAETAIYFIKEFSDNLKQHLKDHNEADLGALGKLKTIDGNLVFEPAYGFDLGFDFYGLPAIKAEPPFIEEHSKAPVETGSVETEESAGEQTTDLENPEEIDHSGDANQSSDPDPKAEAGTLYNTEEEASTLEAIAEDNQLTEENPGDTPTTPLIDSEKANETELLNAKIEALSTYRAKSHGNTLSAAEQEEVIWNLKEPVLVKEKPVNYYTLPDVPPDAEVEKSMSATVKILIVVAIILAAVTAVYFLRPDLFDGLIGKTPQQTQTQITPVTKDTASVKIDSAAINGSIDSSALPASAKDTGTVKSIAPAKNTANPTTASPTNTTDVITYEIIGASVLNQKEADYFIYQMKKSGIHAKALPKEPGKKRLKMSLATFKDRASAEPELKRLAEKLKIEGIYIYPNKQQ